MRSHALIYLNGKRVEIGAEPARMMLSDYLRYEAGLTGTKIVCAEGDCGACTVLRSFAGFSTARTPPPYLPINSCIVTVAQMDGSSLVTVDALADKGELVPAQKSLMNCHASQCGYCTPGFVMALAGLVEKKLSDKADAITERDAKNSFTGNLCRCTGYQPILEAATALALKDCVSVAARFSSAAQLKDLRQALRQPLVMENENFRFSAPTSLRTAVAALKRDRKARLLGGATDLGVVHNKWRQRLQQIISLHLIPELYEIRKVGDEQVSVGARVTLSELRSYVQEWVPEFAKFLDLFASPQIKNQATLVGNVANASPIGDTLPFLLVADAVVETLGPSGKRSIPIEKFFVSYRKTALKTGEIISAIRFARPQPKELLSLRKVSERKDLDISSVSGAFRLDWDSDRRIKEARIAFGGVAETPIRLEKTEAVLKSRMLNTETVEKALRALHGDIAPISDVRGSQTFRRVLAENLLRRFLQEASP